MCDPIISACPHQLNRRILLYARENIDALHWFSLKYNSVYDERGFK